MGMWVKPAVLLHVSAGKGRSDRETSGVDISLDGAHHGLEIFPKYPDLWLVFPFQSRLIQQHGTESSKCWNSKVTRTCLSGPAL